MRRLPEYRANKLQKIIAKLYEKEEFSRLKKLLIRYHPSDIEQAIRYMEPKEIATILKIAGGFFTFELFEFLDHNTQEDVIEFFSNSELKLLLEELPDDERTGFLKNLDDDLRQKLLSLLNIEERQEAETLLSYEDESAASIITKDYASISPEITVKQALKEIRKQAPNKETIYYIYVTDNNNILIGFVSLEKLILANPDVHIEKIMTKTVIFVRDHEDIEKAASIIQKYDLLALPVVDEHEHLLGIITHDDATDILIKEDTEDIEKFMGFTGEPIEESYLKQSTLTHFKRRFTWTLIPLFMQIFSGMVMESYLKDFFILVLYMPMIAATGGNTGSQSATLVIRSLTLGEITFRDTFKVVFKEIRTAALIGFSLGAMIALMILARSYFFHLDSFLIPIHLIIICVALAIFIQVISSSLIGATLPLLATRLKIDPAVMSSPVLASAVDITGLLVYFNIAKLIIGKV